MGKDKESKKHKSEKKKKKEKLEVISSPASWTESASEAQEGVFHEEKLSKKSSKHKSPKKTFKEEMFEYGGSPKKKHQEEEVHSKKKHFEEEVHPIKKHFEEEKSSKKKKHKKDKDKIHLENPIRKHKHEDNLVQFGSDNELLSPTKKSKKHKEFVNEQPISEKRLDLGVNSNHPEVPPDKDEPENIKDELHEHQNDYAFNADAFIEEQVGWPKEDVLTLIENINKVIPSNDTSKYSSRVEKINWLKVQFKGYSSDECKEKWKIIEKKVRGYRILSEMVADAKLWLNKPWSNFYSSQKKNRHPDMPKRPLTSYMLFYLDKKQKYTRKFPNLGMPAISKIIAEHYHKLSDSKKAKYIENSKILRDEYKEKFKQFVEAHPNYGLVLANQAKPKKNEMPGPPKPLSPLQLYIEEQLKKYGDISDQSKAELKLQFKENWKSLSNKKKVPWIRWANEAELKYLAELEVYKSQSPNFEVPKFKSVLTKEHVAILERMEGKPEKPPRSAYSLFSRLILRDNQMKLKNYSPKERMREISRLWALVSDEEKKQYDAKVKHLSQTYKMEYATYLESLPEDKRLEELKRSQIRRKRKKSDGGTDSNDKKLKQTKIEDSFKKKGTKEKKAESESDNDNKGHAQSSDESEQEDSEDDEDGSNSEEHIFNDPQKVDDLRRSVHEKEPSKPAKDAFELFKEIYLTNPANKESKAKMVWNSMPHKEKERYRRKLEDQKQNFILKYKHFLTTLKPSELKVYSSMKGSSNNNTRQSSSKEESSDDEDSDDSDSDQEQLKRAKVLNFKAETSSSSSEEND